MRRTGRDTPGAGGLALGAALALALATAVAGCHADRLGGPGDGVLPGATARGWFPLTAGAYRDYEVDLLGNGVRYLRITLGAPETFFGRTVVPAVYGPVPGLPPDTLLLGLRQYWSYSPAGALWFHGAENRGFASHTDPPVRVLLPVPGPEQAWADTVVFTSFFPGGAVFLSERESFTWTTTPLARIALPAGTFLALRSSATETSLASPALAPRGLALLADPVPVDAVAADPVPADSLPARRGSWFALGHGQVAIDWPQGPTDGLSNSTTFELMGEGNGPLPPRRVAWEDTLTGIRAGTGARAGR